MRLADLVAGIHSHCETDAAMADVAALCEHDRYQASAGINAAAAYVAERAEAAGLSAVETLLFPADGQRRWWTYRAPCSWTPLRARLSVGGVEVVRYPEQPYTLAAYSAATPPGGTTARLHRWSDVDEDADLSGALVVVDTAVSLSTVIDRLTTGGGAGLVIDPLSGRADRRLDQIGRVELPPGARICAFSVNSVAIQRLLAATGAGAHATIEVELGLESVPMPVVTALLPGRGDTSDEILLSAHLCHPRPSANDNASGVAALLGAARVLVRGGRERTRDGGTDHWGVRFLWGPEFTGSAAYLHDVVQAGRAPAPVLAINVDMAGEDLGRCGGPLVIESGPDDLPSPLPALAQRCAALIPPRSRSYSGAVPADAWTWRSSPFAGGSDHALLAAAPTRSPVLSLGHWPDRTNHSSADTVDCVDPAELCRTTTVVAAAVAALRTRADRELAADIAAATTSWAAHRVLDALPGHRPPRPAAWSAEPATVLDAHADTEVHRLLRHRTGVALGAVRTLGLAGVHDGQMRAAEAHVASIATAVLAGFPSVPTATAGDADDGPALVPRWSGPANLRALAELATPDDRAWLDGQLARDRGGNYTRAVALLGGLDGHRGWRGAAWWAALASELPMPVEFAHRFLDVVCRVGWAATAPERGC